MSERCPSWKKPIVGTKPIVPPARPYVVARGAYVGDGRRRRSRVTVQRVGAARDRPVPTSRRACSAERAVRRLLVVVQHVEMAAHGVDVATRHRTGERDFGAPRVSTFSSVARTSGSNAAERHAGGVGESGRLPEQRDEVVGRHRRGRVVRDPIGVLRPGTGACRATPPAARRRRDRRPRTTSPAAGPRRSRATAATAAGAAIRPRRRDAPPAACQLVQRAHAGAVDHQCAGAQARRHRGRGVGDGGVGGGDRARGRRRRPATARSRAGTSSRAAARRTEGDVGRARPATATGVQPRAAMRERQRGPGAAGPHEGERPLRVIEQLSDLFVPAPCWGCRTTRADATLPVRAARHSGRGESTPPSRDRGRPAARARTPARSSADAAPRGRDRRPPRRPRGARRRRGCAGPNAHAGPGARRPRAAGRSAAGRAGLSVGVEGDDRVQVVGLRRAAHRRGLVHRRHRDHRDAGRARQPVDRGLEVHEPVAEVRAEAEVRAPHGSPGASAARCGRRRGRPSRARADGACARSPPPR